MRKLIATLSAAVLLTAVQTQFTGCRQLDQDELSVIDVSTGAITISGSGGSASIDVQSNAYWSVSIVDETGSTVRWVSADVTSGMGDMTLTLTADRNTTAKERKADILGIQLGAGRRMAIRDTFQDTGFRRPEIRLRQQKRQHHRLEPLEIRMEH